MVRAVRVKAMNNYLLFIKFDNGEERIYNCFPLLKEPLFNKLHNKDFFNTVHIDEMGVVCWDSATDIDPYDLYEQSERINDFCFTA